MTFEEFKQNFLPEFLNINTYAGRMRYANERLPRIGSGSGRIVYDIDGQKVLKLAKNAKGVAQNGAEAGAGYYRDTQHIVTEVFDSADDDTWLIAEKGKKVTDKRIRELTGIPSLDKLNDFLRIVENDQKPGRNIFSHLLTDEEKEFFWENEFASDLADFAVNYGQHTGDMGRPSSYGEVMRDGQPAIVLTDYGLNDEVYDSHYSGKHKQRYQMYELFNYADGNDDILSDTGDQGDIRRGMWALTPYSVDDGDGVFNEDFVRFVSERNEYPDVSVKGIPVLADAFHECKNNIRQVLGLVENKQQFYENFLKLQEYLIRRGFYTHEPLMAEQHVIGENEVPDVEYASMDDKGYAQELAKQVANKLELTAPRYMGGGGFGHAFEINDNMVLKITSDMGEADAGLRLMRANPKHLGRVFNVYKVFDTVQNKAYFALLEENINDKPIERFRKYEADINKIMPQGMNYGDILIAIKKPKRFNQAEMQEFAKHVLTDNPEAGVSEADRQAAYEFLLGIFAIRQELLDYGIKSTDYISMENLGYKNGDLIFFDIGGHIAPQPDIDDQNLIQLPEDGSAKFSSATAINQDEFPPYDTNDTSPMINNDLDANIALYNEDLEYVHVDGDATQDEYRLEERKKDWVKGSKAVEVKKKCRLGGLGNTSAACNQGDISNLKLTPLEEIIDLEIKEYFSSLVPRIDEDIMTLQDLPFKKEIEQLGGNIYSVGGAVRDEFLGKQSKDLDILITGVPMDKLAEIMSPYGKVDAVGKQFGVLKFKPQGAREEIDVAIPRTEKATGEGGHKGFDVSSDHTLPIEKDLERRDFTINAIAKDIDGNIIDPYGGQEDLKNKIIKIVNPEAFSDDPLRMLRAVQFAARFGFNIDDETRKMIKQNASRIKEIPAERILTEFDKIVQKGNPFEGAYLLKDLGLTPQIFGGDAGLYMGKEWQGVQTMGEFLWLTAHHLVQDIAEYCKSKLKCDIETYKELKALQQAFQADENMDAVTARTLAHNIYKISPKTLNSKILPEPIKAAAQELMSGKYPKDFSELAVDGNVLMSMGLQGKQIGDMLKSLLLKVYGDNVRNDKEELLSLVRDRDNEVKEGYAYYHDTPPKTWNVNGQQVTIDFFVKEYDKWNYQGGRAGYPDASKESVLEFLQNNYEDFSTDEKLKKELYWALTDRDLLKEDDMEQKVRYSAVVLDDESHAKLVQVFAPMIPEGWETIAHHMTINMGALDAGSDAKQDMENDVEVKLNVVDYAMDNLVMAVGVEGYPSSNAKPHVTIAVNRAEGGKPYLSNKLNDWKPLSFPLQLTGKVTEVK